MSLQKRAPRYSTNDWFTRSYSNWNNSEKTRVAAKTVLEESKYMRSEADNKAKWDQHDTNTRLSDWVERLRGVKEYFSHSMKGLDEELDKMSLMKNISGKLQHFVYRVQQVNTENLVLREGRREIDLAVDEVEDELINEKSILDSVRDKIQARISEMFEQLGVTKEIKYKMMGYLQKKEHSKDVDIDQYNLNENSSTLTLKPDSTRVPEKMYNMDEWDATYCSMKALANHTVSDSIKLREVIHHIIHVTSNDIHSQNLILMFAFRKRIHDLEMTLSEDRFQKELLEEQSSKLEDEIRCIDVSIKHKVTALKLAETRLENRQYKIQEDLVRDSVQYGLMDEVSQLERCILTQKDKKCQAQHALSNMEAQILTLRTDIDNKMLALRIEQQCLESRNQLNPDFSLDRELDEAMASCLRGDVI